MRDPEAVERRKKAHQASLIRPAFNLLILSCEWRRSVEMFFEVVGCRATFFEIENAACANQAVSPGGDVGLTS